jgi:uncharacterized protein YlzI (FlbEa/FlbD family)
MKNVKQKYLYVLIMNVTNVIKISVIFVLTTFVLSGCIGDKQMTPSPESLKNETIAVMQSPTAIFTIDNLSNCSYPEPVLLKEENLPEVNLVSFSSGYFRTNIKKSLLYSWGVPGRNLSEKYYVVYHLTLKNNYSNTLNFSSHYLHLVTGDEIFNTTINYSEELFYQLNPIEENATILPGQTINGSIVFQVNSPTNKSLLLLYNSTPLILPSFEKSIEAQTTAELFNYSIAFGIPQFNLDDYCDVNVKDLRPEDLYQEPYPIMWPNWIDRSVIEFYKKLDSENLEIEYLHRKIHRKNPDLPITTIKYVITVMPDRNITLLPGDRFIIKDESGDEIINQSIGYCDTGLAILNNQEYEIYSEEIPQINFNNVTVVQISFDNFYGWGLCARMTLNDQILIIDNNQNIVLAICDQGHFVS